MQKAELNVAKRMPQEAFSIKSARAEKKSQVFFCVIFFSVLKPLRHDDDC